MPLNPLEGFQIGKEVGKSKRSTFSRMSEGVLSDFDESVKSKRKYDYDVALQREKAKADAEFQAPKDKAMTEYYNASTNWMNKNASGDVAQDNPELVLDSVSRSGPRFVNARARLLQKEAGAQATQLPKLDRAFDAVQNLKTQYQSSLSPVSIKKGSNPLVGYAQKTKQGITGRIGASTGTNPNLERYLANRGGFASLISKGGFLEAGVLTEGDIQRMLKILPDEYSTKEESDIAWQEIESILGGARQQYESTVNSMSGGRADTAQDASLTSSSGDKRAQYNELRAQGMTNEQARAKLGL